MKIKKLEIFNLYGYINKSIIFKEITFLVGNNGVGKTSILSIIKAFFEKKVEFFYEIEFDKIIFELEIQSKNIIITITQTKTMEKILENNEIIPTKTICIVSEPRINNYRKEILIKLIKEKEEVLKTNQDIKELKNEIEDLKKELKEVDSKQYRMKLSSHYYEQFFKTNNDFISIGIENQKELKKMIENIINDPTESESFEKIQKMIDPIVDIKSVWRTISMAFMRKFIDILLKNKEKKVNYKEIDDYNIIERYLTILNRFLKDSNKEIVFNENENYEFLLKNNGNKNIDISYLSSGEKKILILCTRIILELKNSSSLIIDEPENSLHIQWQELLSEMFNNFLEYSPTSQLIVATHSPYIVSEIDIESIISLDSNYKGNI